MGMLYISENGAVVGLKGGKFSIKSKGEEKLVPKHSVSVIGLFGNSQLTTQCIKYCLNENIRVSYFNSNGKYVGALNPTHATNINRLKKQLFLFDDDNFSIAMSKQVVSAKIHNQITTIRRRKSENDEILENISMMKIMKEKVASATSVEEIIGYEGVAAKYYFDAFSKIIDPVYEFKGRNRRPPKDPVNAMLSFGYSLLESEIIGEIESVGLNPYSGFLHKESANNPSLASDLIEEWRPVIVDSVVLSIVQSKDLVSLDFDYTEDGCYLNSEGRKIFLYNLQKKMHTENQYLDYVSRPVSFRMALFHQLECMARVVETGQTAAYLPVRIR